MNNNSNGNNELNNNAQPSVQNNTNNVNSVNTTSSVNQTNTVNPTPQVVNVAPQAEIPVTTVASETPTNENMSKSTKPPKKGKGKSILLVLLFLFFIAFVYFLPDITSYITNYQKEKNQESMLMNGTLTCNITISDNDVNRTVETIFRYRENALKSTRTTTTNRLTDTAVDNSALTEADTNCNRLKGVLTETTGMSCDCTVSATMQQTVQEIDYEKLDMNYVTTNITEFEGFYPEYELDDNIRQIEVDMERAGYSCTRNETSASK